MSELKENILKLRKEGFNYDEIKQQLNCSKGTISYHCEKNGMGGEFLKYLKFHISKDDEKIIIELRKNGKIYDDIKKSSNLSIDKIKLICRKNNISNHNELRKPTDDIIIKMQKYYDDCHSCAKVADFFGWNRHTVSKYITIKRTRMTEEERKKSKVANVINWRKDKKLKLIEYKGGGCEICKYNKSIRALSFHHRNPKMKDFNISAKSYSFERLKQEVDKCVLVCSNCHSEIHDEIQQKGYSEIINKLGI
jgi:hypothetical protein